MLFLSWPTFAAGTQPGFGAINQTASVYICRTAGNNKKFVDELWQLKNCVQNLNFIFQTLSVFLPEPGFAVLRQSGSNRQRMYYSIVKRPQ